jgi:hypothetical protein
MSRNIIFHVTGGIGKNLMATAVAKAIHNANPEDKIIVVAAWPQIWLNNENIHRVYKLGATQYFYEDYIKDQKIKLICHDPYLHEDFIQNKRHCIDIWCEQAGVRYNGELPNVNFTSAEVEIFNRRFQSNQPILVLQTNGGMPSSQRYMTSWARDLPYKNAQEVVNFANNRGWKVYHIRFENQPGLANTEPIWRDNIREILGLLTHSKARLLIDSFAQHFCAGINLKSVVCWPTNNVTSLGYNLIHTNIVAPVTEKTPCLIDAYLRDYNISGELHECPYPPGTELFSSEEIIKNLFAVSSEDTEETTIKQIKQCACKG